MTVRERIKIVLETNWFSTLRINLHYFPLRIGLKMPILVSYRTSLQSMRGRVTINGPIGTGMMLFGFRFLGSVDPYYERSIWSLNGSIELRGKDISLGRGTRLCVTGLCSFGKHFMLTGNSSIICRHKIIFGDNVLISWETLMMDTDYHTIMDEYGARINPDQSITIGDNVWIGCRTTVLKGSTIPSNSVVAACSVIAGILSKEGTIYAGNGRILKTNISWQR